MEIEVEWKVNVKSGLTTINLEDMGVKNKVEWSNLQRIEQEKLINEYLMDSETYIHAIVTDW